MQHASKSQTHYSSDQRRFSQSYKDTNSNINKVEISSMTLKNIDDDDVGCLHV